MAPFVSSVWSKPDLFWIGGKANETLVVMKILYLCTLESIVEIQFIMRLFLLTDVPGKTATPALSP